jgi:hypothetical protein
MPFPTIGQPMPRAVDACATADKWQGWILAVVGHSEEWARVFRASPQDGERIWAAISAAVRDAPVSVVRDRAPHGAVCGVDVTLTINDRTSSVATSWHYPDENAAPRLVTAYPNG